MKQYYTRKMSEKLRCDLEGTNSDEVKVERRIYVDLPPIASHQGHVLGDVSFYWYFIDRLYISQWKGNVRV